MSGKIFLSRNDTTILGGSWRLNRDGGTLIGSMDGTSLRISLNPNMIDDNTWLYGERSGEKISGSWQHAGIMGVDRSGSFTAVRY